MAGNKTKPDLRAQLVQAARLTDPRPSLARLGAEHTPGVLVRMLAGLQDSQYGTAQALAAGMTWEAVRWLCTSGESEHLRTGVWRFRSAAGDPDPAVTAWLACWPRGVIAGRSAALEHGLIRNAPAVPEVSILKGGTRAPAGVNVRVTRRLDWPDRKLFGAVQYTAMARTVCDLADPLHVSTTLSFVDDAVARGAKPRWLNRRATALAPGRPGIAIVRDATAPGAAAAFRSWLERAGMHVYLAARLPRPEVNLPIYDDRGLIGLADAAWPQWWVISEKEGLRFHNEPAVPNADAERFNRYEEARWTPRRFTWHDVVNRPVYVATTVARALAAAGADVDPSRVPAHIEVPPLPFTR